MTIEPDQPWRVFTRRPAPLASLFQSERERLRGNRARVEDEPLAGEGPLTDAGGASPFPAPD